MIPLADMVLNLVDSLPLEEKEGENEELVVSSVDLQLPMESRLGEQQVFRASLPRDRIVTGFQNPVGRVRLTFHRLDREER